MHSVADQLGRLVLVALLSGTVIAAPAVSAVAAGLSQAHRVCVKSYQPCGDACHPAAPRAQSCCDAHAPASPRHREPNASPPDAPAPAPCSPHSDCSCCIVVGHGIVVLCAAPPAAPLSEPAATPTRDTGRSSGGLAAVDTLLRPPIA
jgi:hypothetical protein